MRLVWASVTEVQGIAEGVQSLGVALDDGRHGSALAFLRLCAECAVGDRVLLNTTAVDLELGTGGRHFVLARLGDGEGIALDDPSGGHIMKMRYTPLQIDVNSVEAQESPHHEAMRAASSLEGMPVVCCGLHSQVPLVAAAAKRANPRLRIAYCMTDGAALSMQLSDLVRASRQAGLLDASISCGQAFGGEFEAVNLHSGLLAARHVAGADVAIAAIGPGVVGTATPFGHGGVAVGEAINAVGVLGGVPVACLRVSFADTRERHRGVSHHTLAALTQIALVSAQVALPALPQEFSDSIRDDLDEAGVWELHVPAQSSEGMTEPPSLRGVNVSTMGRGMADDPAFFASAFAAGEIASRNVPAILE